MIKVKTVEFRNNLKHILEQADKGQQIILVYYGKNYVLRPALKETEALKVKRLSPQAKQILIDINSSNHKRLADLIKTQLPNLNSMTNTEMKEYIWNEKAKKYDQ